MDIGESVKMNLCRFSVIPLSSQHNTSAYTGVIPTSRNNTTPHHHWKTPVPHSPPSPASAIHSPQTPATPPATPLTTPVPTPVPSQPHATMTPVPRSPPLTCQCNLSPPQHTGAPLHLQHHSRHHPATPITARPQHLSRNIVLRVK
ncbi:hypothetical protein DEO72_LG10g1362 [Vigna unguiculata]|uniref:Uncharacterized protein n=1 Tax=Vigna unguiculata TaxID=3917 RepID=A0A4D6N8P7_VIGUN|nr:hypothetical protein DEO72_LG10g1362 [Vigna unguiculata]